MTWPAPVPSRTPLTPCAGTARARTSIIQHEQRAEQHSALPDTPAMSASGHCGCALPSVCGAEPPHVSAGRWPQCRPPSPAQQPGLHSTLHPSGYSHANVHGDCCSMEVLYHGAHTVAIPTVLHCVSSTKPICVASDTCSCVAALSSSPAEASVAAPAAGPPAASCVAARRHVGYVNFQAARHILRHQRHSRHSCRHAPGRLAAPRAG